MEADVEGIEGIEGIEEDDEIEEPSNRFFGRPNTSTYNRKREMRTCHVKWTVIVTIMLRIKIWTDGTDIGHGDEDSKELAANNHLFCTSIIGWIELWIQNSLEINL